MRILNPAWVFKYLTILIIKVCENLELAEKYSSNELEKKMLEEYRLSFLTGKLHHHKARPRGSAIVNVHTFIVSHPEPDPDSYLPKTSVKKNVQSRNSNKA